MAHHSRPFSMNLETLTGHHNGIKFLVFLWEGLFVCWSISPAVCLCCYVGLSICPSVGPYWAIADLTYDCREGKTAKKSIFAQFWTHFWTPVWPGRLPRFIQNGPKWRAKPPINFLFIYECCTPYFWLQKRKNWQKAYFCSISDPFLDLKVAS